MKSPRLHCSLALVIAAASMAGCFESADSPPSGEEIVQYYEGWSSLSKLEAYLLSHTNDLISCSHPPPSEANIREYMNATHLGALRAFISFCMQSGWETLQAVVDAAIHEGTAEELYNSRLSDALGWSESATNAIDRHGIPTSVADLQIMSRLMVTDASRISELEQAPTHFHEFSENGSRADLLTAVSKLEWVRLSANVTIVLLETFPWDPGTGCVRPGGLWDEVRQLYGRVVSVAASMSDPEDAKWASTPYGKLIRTTGPYFEYYAAYDWWPAALSVRASLSWDDAFWENLTSGPRASPEEAARLIDQYRSNTRSLTADLHITHFEAEVREALEGGIWTENQAVRASALPALDWSFWLADCADFV